MKSNSDIDIWQIGARLPIVVYESDMQPLLHSQTTVWSGRDFDRLALLQYNEKTANLTHKAKYPARVKFDQVDAFANFRRTVVKIS